MSSRAAETVECSTCGEREEGHPDWLGHTFWIEVEVTETTAQVELRERLAELWDESTSTLIKVPSPRLTAKKQAFVDALMEVVRERDEADHWWGEGWRVGYDDGLRDRDSGVPLGAGAAAEDIPSRPREARGDD